MKNILRFILCINLGLVLVSCSYGNNINIESSKSEGNTDSSGDSATNQRNENADIQESKKSIEDTKNTTNDSTTQTTENKTSNLITLTTYIANEDTLAINPLSTIKVEKNLSLKDKLTKLADELSTREFKGLPIKVVKVETINGTKKATVNLEDFTNDPTTSWSRTYFQGTTGGSITSKILIETFKQPSYSGEWINSVVFLYNNQKIEFEHVQNLENEITLR